MDYDKFKVDDMVLALMSLTTFGDKDFVRSWKGYDWGAMERLHKAGLIQDPVGKAKSVGLTEDGARKSQELFRKHFGRTVE